MATGTTARDYGKQMTHYMRRTVNFNDTGIATGVLLGKLPTGAKISHCVVGVETIFNSAGTNRLVVGTNSSSFNNVMTSTVAAAGTAGGKQSVVGAALAFTQDTDVYIKYTAATGTAATTGKASVVLYFAPNNDIS